MADVQLKVNGVPEMAAKLRALPTKLRVRVLRNALAAGARVVRDEARRRTPLIAAGDAAVQRGTRKPGTVRDAIVVRTSKAARQAGNVGVFVNVRPAKGARFKTSTVRAFGFKVSQRTQVRASKRGAKSPNDPFYWRFLEFGWSRRPQGYGFLQAGAQKLGEALRGFEQAFAKHINRYDQSKGQQL